MHVVATAGHVDHGKSTLVKALTGMEPDRLSEEHRRGLSIELGYCWTSLGAAGDVAFVDVPGHERFLSTMLSGIGPVPAVLFVVAADDPWMPQAAEHLAALDALEVSRGVVAVTRSDLADPAPARDRVAAELRTTSLRYSPIVAVCARTGEGLDELRDRLAAMVGSLPEPDPTADVRLWVDRRFSVKGSGTVVTGTLQAGRIRVGDELESGSRLLRVRGIQSLGAPAEYVDGVARVALNLAGNNVAELGRGGVLVTPSAWHFTDVVDVRIRPTQVFSGASTKVPQAPFLHVGAAAVSTYCRALSAELVRLRLERELPLRVGDRAVLRDPGSRTLWGLTVLDPAPPPLARRGAAAEWAKILGSHSGKPDPTAEVDRRGLVHLSLLERIGVTPPREWRGPHTGGWLLSEDRRARESREIERIVADHDQRSPLDPGVPLVALAERLRLPSVELVRTLVQSPLLVVDGRVLSGRAATLPADLERALAAVAAELADTPFAAPTADRLRELGLDARAIAAAARAGRLLRLVDGIVLLPGADRLAAQWLGDLPQPFTPSQARVRLHTSRRVVLPLLAHLDETGATRRFPDDRRTVVR